MKDTTWGVLLANLGTPSAPTTRAVRRYLAEFLWDPRVVEAPRWLWWLALHGVILRIRPRRSAALYRRVWTPEGSPLLVLSRRQAAGLQSELARRAGREIPLELGMRYGAPSIASALEALAARGAQRILVLPAYPQYAASTVAATFDAVADALRRWRALPEMRYVNGYSDRPDYLDALAGKIRRARAGAPAEKLLLSFHGIPQRYVDAGDPYLEQCRRTAEEVARRLDLAPADWAMAFQSRVGREPWLQPYTDEQLVEWGRGGVQSVDVACPGFSVDCLETIDEIGREARAMFLESGGRELRYIAALNDDPEHLASLASLVLDKTSDWSV